MFMMVQLVMTQRSFVVSVFLLLTFLSPWYVFSETIPSSSYGFLDYTEHNFASDGIVELAGEWLIFWEQLLEPEDLKNTPLAHIASQSDGVFQMPHTWNSWQFNDKPVDGFGYATFVTELQLPQDMQRFSLWIPNASTTYRLWIEDELVARNGVPGTNQQESKPHYIVQTASHRVENVPVRLILQVSNYHHRRGGMWRSLRLGTPEQIRVLDIQETTYDLLLFGSFIALGLFNLFLYFNQRYQMKKNGFLLDNSLSHHVPLLLAITFFAMTARVFVTGQILVTRLIPTFPWALQLKIEYLSAMVVFAMFSLIAERAYPNVVPKVVVKVILIFVAINAIIALLFSPLVYSRIVTSYNITKSIVLLGLSVRFVIWLIRGNREAWPMVGAILIFFLITFGETLHYREVILSRDFAPVGFIVSLLSPNGINQPFVYLVSTIGTLGVMLVVFNWFAVKVSIAFLQSQSNQILLDKDVLKDSYNISPREIDILELVACGISNKEIGNRLYITEGTVKNHLHRIMRKLNVGSRTEIVARFAKVDTSESSNS
jgi:DNA-binding CsgD family transcriptional regulator